MRRERRLNTMKVVKINKFEEIENSTKTYMTPTNIRIIVEKVSDEDYTLKFDIKTLHMIVDVDINDRKCRLEIDDMECPYLTIKTDDLSKEIEIMLKQSHVKHGLE